MEFKTKNNYSLCQEQKIPLFPFPEASPLHFRILPKIDCFFVRISFP